MIMELNNNNFFSTILLRFFHTIFCFYLENKIQTFLSVEHVYCGLMNKIASNEINKNN